MLRPLAQGRLLLHYSCPLQARLRNTLRNKPSERSKSNFEPVKKRSGVTKTLNRAKSAADEKIAVALSYDPSDEYSAPEVVATGRGHIAEQLLKLALEHGVKIHEDADLAEILHALDIGDEIPVEAFVAVAEILRYIYESEGVQPPEIAANAE